MTTKNYTTTVDPVDKANRDEKITNLIGQFWNNINGTTRTQEFELYKENTAYQRAVDDMIAAGLNPALMFSNGNAESSATHGGSGSPLSLIPNLLNNAATMKDANTRRLNEIENNKHLTEKEKNYMEAMIMKTEAYRERTMQMSNAKAEFSQRKYTKKDFENVYENLDTVEL